MILMPKTPGIFTISIDVEHAWGVCDRNLQDAEKKRIIYESEIIKRLLTTFERYKIPATWAVTSHLFDKQACTAHNEVYHPEYPRPISRDKRDWFFQHPKTPQDSLWHCPDILDWIRKSNPEHEIGSHSYSHISYNEKATNELAIAADITNILRAHGENKSQPTTFIFPRNAEGYHSKLANAGFVSYRGKNHRWHDNIKPRSFSRAINLCRYFLGTTPKAVKVQRGIAGLINIPDSMLFLGRNGIRSYIPRNNLYKMAVKGLNRTMEEGKVFHLWFHPSNFSYDEDIQFNNLSKILEHAAELKIAGKIEISTMQKIAKDFLEEKSE